MASAMPDHQLELDPPAYLQWHWLRERRIALLEERDLRWCLNCGRSIGMDVKCDAVTCSPSCRERLRQRRRARGQRAGEFSSYSCDGDRYSRRSRGVEDYVRGLAQHRARAFALAHGRPIEQAPLMNLPRWGEEGR